MTAVDPAVQEHADWLALTEEQAWQRVLSDWDNETAHQGYLSRVRGMEGYMDAGGRYKVALDEHPGDPIAARWRDEVLKRATVQALAQLPRTPLPGQSSRARRFKNGIALGAGVLLIGVIIWAVLLIVRSLKMFGAEP